MPTFWLGLKNSMHAYFYVESVHVLAAATCLQAWMRGGRLLVGCAS